MLGQCLITPMLALCRNLNAQNDGHYTIPASRRNIQQREQIAALRNAFNVPGAQAEGSSPSKAPDVFSVQTVKICVMRELVLGAEAEG